MQKLKDSTRSAAVMIKSFGKALSGIFGVTLRPPKLDTDVQEDRKKKRTKLYAKNFTRRYSLITIIAFFFTFAFIGWLWEVLLVLVRHKTFANRGVLHGPWLPIYGFGGVLVLTILYRLRNRPALHIGMTALLCGSVEYLTSVALEKIHGVKWWDYTGYFLNINGRVCAEALLVFVVCGTVTVYLVAPLLDDLYKKIPTKIFTVICVILTVIFLADTVYSQFVPNVGYGITS